MKGLWQYLKPFSPDTSGFCSVVSGTDGVGILDDPQGCVMNYLAFEETQEGPERVFQSRLTNTDVIFGSERCILDRYEESAKPLDPKFALFGSGPASALTGTDLELVSGHFTAQYGIPSAPVDVTGFRNYDDGVSAALCAMAELLVRPMVKQPGSINLLGCCPLDNGGGAGEAVKRWAEREGVTSVISAWGGDTSAAEMSRAAAAERNLVLSADAIPLAEYFKQRFGTPYIVGLPLGGKLRGVSGIAEDSVNRARCLILGEQFAANAVREYLEAELGYTGVAVAGFFQMLPAYMRPSDAALKSEDDLNALLRDMTPEICVCDPEFQPLLPSGVRLVPLVHRAVSGKRYLSEIPELMDTGYLEFLESEIG